MTLRKEVLQHLGVKPGDKIAAEVLPDGKASLSAIKPRTQALQSCLPAVIFADGVIAFEGAQSNGSTFLTFDEKAARSVKKIGLEAQLLA